MDHISALPIFIAVADLQGFTAAAKELGLSKSAVSKRITQLEHQLGVRLLHRSTRKLSLTEAGERFYEHATLACLAAQNAEDVVAEMQGEPQGLLKVVAPMSFGLRHVAPLVATFLQHYPKIQLDLVLDDKRQNIVEQGFDLAIQAGDLPDSNLIARPLAPLRSVVCAAPSFIQYHRLSSPYDLEKLNCILYSYSSNSAAWHFFNQEEDIQVNVRGNFRANNSEAVKDALLDGLGIGRLPTFIAGHYVREGRLVQLFDHYHMPEKTLYAIYPERNYVPAKVKAFYGLIKAKFHREQPYWDDQLFQ